MRTSNSKRDDRKLLIKPPVKRKGIIGWKLSKNKPLFKSNIHSSNKFSQRSQSTRPDFADLEKGAYAGEIDKLYHSHSKDLTMLNKDRHADMRNKTLEAQMNPSRLLK